MPMAHSQVEKFLTEQHPDVVVYDVAMPYASNWDLLDAIRQLPSVASLPFVVTTPNKRELHAAVGRTRTLAIGGRATDLTRLLKAVEKAASTPATRQ
jgi:CheY-like chemotaxis protein